MLGYRVMAFTDPVDAAEYFKSHQNDFDGVVTDLTMPKMTGLDLANFVNALRSDIPLVLRSGFARSAREVQGKLSGAWEFIEKPIQPDSVGWAIRKALDKRKANVVQTTDP
jgi:DNA-binding NtrC family response regulator